MRSLQEIQEEMKLFNETRIPRCFICKTIYELIHKEGQAEIWQQQCNCSEQQRKIRLCLLPIKK